MTNSVGLQVQAEKRARLFSIGVLGLAVLWGLLRTARSLQIHYTTVTPPCHDLYSYYEIWSVLGHRSCADFALRESLYFPHTWIFFTPMFILGWPTARVLMFVINLGAVFYIWWRLSELCGLEGFRRWLLLAFFFGWSGTGNVIGLGNLALVSLATMLAAYPFKSTGSGIFLMLAAMKQSLVFPLYFHLLLKRSKALIIPFATFALSGLAALWWAHMSFADGLGLPKYWADSAGGWTTIDHTCLRRLLALFTSNALVISLAKWIIWFAMFGIATRWIKDPVAQLAAWLLLALLPTYHYSYDMIVAVPVLAILLKRCRLVWPVGMTFFLACNFFNCLAIIVPAGALRNACLTLHEVYCPLLILLFFAGLVFMEVRQPAQAQGAQPQAEAPASA